MVANDSLVQYNEITPENIDSFHFHGDMDSLPISAVLTVPADEKSRVLVQGRYQAHEGLQMLEPTAIMDQLLETVFAIQRYVLIAMALVAIATGAVVTLVFLLSWRARKPEQETLIRLGGSPTAIASLMLAEVVVVLLLALLVAGILLLLSLQFAAPLLRALVM